LMEKLLIANMEKLKISRDFAGRYLNDGFSGGEKKRVAVLQMLTLKPSFAILDEPDSGLDIDAIRIVADGVNAMRSENFGCLMITHYQRILDYVTPDFVHVMINGKIVASGGPELARELEANGYEGFEEPDLEQGAISMSIWEFKRYLEQYKDLKRGFDLDGVVNCFYWDENVAYDEHFDLKPELPDVYSSAKSTEFAKMLRSSDCVISSRPVHWDMGTRKWLIDHGILTNNLHLRSARYKPTKNDCIIFKAATIEEQGVKIYLDDEKEIANGVKNVLPNLVTCYLDIQPSTTQIVLRY